MFITLRCDGSLGLICRIFPPWRIPRLLVYFLIDALFPPSPNHPVCYLPRRFLLTVRFDSPPTPSRSPNPNRPSIPPSSRPLDDGLELPRVAKGILDDGLAEVLLDVIGVGTALGRSAGSGGGEVDVAVADGPAAGPGEVDDSALGVQEQQRLRAAQR